MTYRYRAVHLSRQDGRSKCGKRGAQLTRSKKDVTCMTCLAIALGTHGIGNRQPDSEHGTAARYRWHLRHEGAPVRCEACLQGERRRGQDYRRAA